jgi:hypothetical protein
MSDQHLAINVFVAVVRVGQRLSARQSLLPSHAAHIVFGCKPTLGQRSHVGH